MADAQQRAADLPTDDRSTVIIAIAAVLLSLTSIIVALRFYVRGRMLNSLGADDWMSLVSLVFVSGCTITVCVMTRYGLGRHIWTLSPQTLKNYYKLFYISINFYAASLGAIKLAFLQQYYRIFAVQMRWIIIVAMLIVGGWSLSLLLVNIFMCNPIQGYWDKDLNPKCIPNLPLWYINAAVHITTDVVIFILPIPVLWKMRLPLGQRWWLIAIFCLGFFTCAISAIRIPFLNLKQDDTYYNVDAASWSISELCCGLICLCLPTLRRLLPHGPNAPRLPPRAIDTRGPRAGTPPAGIEQGSRAGSLGQSNRRSFSASSTEELRCRVDDEIEMVGSDGSDSPSDKEAPTAPAPGPATGKIWRTSPRPGLGASVEERVGLRVGSIGTITSIGASPSGGLDIIPGSTRTIEGIQVTRDLVQRSERTEV